MPFQSGPSGNFERHWTTSQVTKRLHEKSIKRGNKISKGAFLTGDLSLWDSIRFIYLLGICQIEDSVDGPVKEFLIDMMVPYLELTRSV